MFHLPPRLPGPPPSPLPSGQKCIDWIILVRIPEVLLRRIIGSQKGGLKFEIQKADFLQKGPTVAPLQGWMVLHDWISLTP